MSGRIFTGLNPEGEHTCDVCACRFAGEVDVPSAPAFACCLGCHARTVCIALMRPAARVRVHGQRLEREAVEVLAQQLRDLQRAENELCHFAPSEAQFHAALQTGEKVGLELTTHRRRASIQRAGQLAEMLTPAELRAYVLSSLRKPLPRGGCERPPVEPAKPPPPLASTAGVVPWIMGVARALLGALWLVPAPKGAAAGPREGPLVDWGSLDEDGLPVAAPPLLLLSLVDEDAAVMLWLQGAVLGLDYNWCPSCQVLVEKDDGCDHVQCDVCDTEFCFGCGLAFVDDACDCSS